jgi:putative cardiolipin synthase
MTRAQSGVTIGLQAIAGYAAQICAVIVGVAALGACATNPPGADYPRTESLALTHPEETHLGGQFAGMAAEHGGASGFRILTVGLDGFLARAEMIDAAERTLDLQYYIFRGDDTGRLLTDGLLRAADRGVRVRVLIDDGDTVSGDEQIIALAAHPLVEVRIFNPFAYRGHSTFRRALEFASHVGRLDFRMHNKLLVVDNTLALVGGRNIGNQYFQVDPDSQFADDDVFAAGPIARQLSATFDEYWNSPLSIPVEALGRLKKAASSMAAQRERSRWHPAALVEPAAAGGSDYVTRIATGEPYASLISGQLPLVWASARVLCDSPNKKDVVAGVSEGRLMMTDVRKMIAATEGEFLMITPYFVPADAELDALRDLRQRNVAVGIVTNSLESTRDLAAFSGYTNYRKALLEEGVSLYEVRAQPGSTRGSGQTARMSSYGHYGLHGKLMVFDRRQIFIGSMNFDQRSKRLNTEVGLLIDSTELATQTASRFEAMAQQRNSYGLSLRSQDSGGTGRIVWRTEQGGKLVEYAKEPAQSDWRRLTSHLLSLVPLSGEL